VEVLRGLPHDEGVHPHELLGEEPRVRVGLLAHGVAAHVLDAAGDDDVLRAGADRVRGVRDRRERTRAHPVHGVAGHALRQAREDRRRPADRQALVADLRRGRPHVVVDARRVEVRVALEQAPDRADDEVVGAGLAVVAVGLGPSDRGAHPVDVDRVTKLSHGGSPARG
jgi:hypothetical protein